jgi:hypothetical protein
MTNTIRLLLFDISSSSRNDIGNQDLANQRQSLWALSITSLFNLDVQAEAKLASNPLGLSPP